MPGLAHRRDGQVVEVKRYIDGGEALLAAFRALDVDYVFCCSGSEWAPVWEAMARQKLEATPGPGYIDLWHETVAVGMATGYALIRRRPQPVLLHAGPGLLQGACAVHGALLTGVPMLVLSSESITYGERPGRDPGSQWYRNLSVVGGPHSLVPHIFKWANQAPTVETLFEMVVRAGELSQRAPAAPVYLNVPVEVLLEPWAGGTTSRTVAPPGRKVSAGEEIERLAERLCNAANPVLLAETAGREAETFRALTELCELLAIPVIESQGAVSANFPRNHPLHLGSDVEPLSKSADLVVLVNCRAPWYPPSAAPSVPTICIDEVPQRPHIVYQVLRADQYLEGAVADTLRLTLAAVKRRRPDPQIIDARRARHTQAHNQLTASLEQAEQKALARTDRIDAVRLVAELRSLSSTDAIFVDETITHSRVLQQHLRLDEPNRYYYVQGGLGQGIAVALGVKLAAKATPVILAIGDGSFIYNPTVASLAASRDLRLPLLIVIFNNRQYLSMKYNHLRAYPDGAAVSSGQFLGVDLATQPDLADFARPFDMFGLTVEDPGALRPGLQAALTALGTGQTAIVNVMLEK
jgi:acetolactate synthase I/II/III large subunit